jgi:hypothetical protein
MSSWGNNDNAANAPLWAADTVNLRPTRTNVTNLFDNTTANSFAVTLGDGSVRNNNKTVGLFLINEDETQVSEASGGGSGVQHAGWSVKTVGVGGRAGRVTWETLVTLANPGSVDSTTQTMAPTVVISFTQQPANQSVVHGVGNSAVFTVGVSTVPAYDTITYQWQVSADGGNTWANVANNTPANTNYVGAQTGALSVYPTGTGANNYKFRALVWATDTNIAGSLGTATSGNSTITIS